MNAVQAPANPPPVWGLDPIWDAYVKMSVSLLHRAVMKAVAPKQKTEGSSVEGAVLVLGSGRVATKVRALGYVVSVKDSANARDIMLDDGTGMLSCIIFRNDINKNIGLTPFLDPEVKLLGTLLHVGGPVDFYAGKPQLKVFFASIEQDVNGEVLFWLDTIDLHSNVYSAPFAPLMPLADDHSLEGEPNAKSRKKLVQDVGAAALEQAIASFAQQRQAFLFSELLLDASILRAAALSLRSTAPPLNGGSGATNEQKNGRVDGTAASYEERVAVTHAVGRLRHKGEVLLTDKAADGYASCSLTQDVCPAVLRIFQAQHQKEYALNVLDIQREAKPHAVLSCVGRERLEHALEHLVGESKLYSTGPGLYKLLT